MVERRRRARRADRGSSFGELSPHSRPTRRHVDLCRQQRRKRGYQETDEHGTFWRGIAIDSDTRLRVGRAIGKTEEEVARELMAQLKDRRGHPDVPPGMASDGKGGYREALLQTWGQVPEYRGVGRPPTLKRPQPGWRYLQVIKSRSEGRLTNVTIKVVYGNLQEVVDSVGAHTAYVERTNLTARQMNGRLVRKTLSYSKQLEALEASCAWEDWVYNLTRPLKTLALELEASAEAKRRRWKRRTPAMAAELTDHIWTIKELLSTVIVPQVINTK
jgi:hypothetical protein